jgi:hypothetical protein
MWFASKLGLRVDDLSLDFKMAFMQIQNRISKERNDEVIEGRTMRPRKVLHEAEFLTREGARWNKARGQRWTSSTFVPEKCTDHTDGRVMGPEQKGMNNIY